MLPHLNDCCHTIERRVPTGKSQERTGLFLLLEQQAAAALVLRGDCTSRQPGWPAAKHTCARTPVDPGLSHIVSCPRHTDSCTGKRYATAAVRYSESKIEKQTLFAQNKAGDNRTDSRRLWMAQYREAAATMAPRGLLQRRASWQHGRWCAACLHCPLRWHQSFCRRWGEVAA